MPASKWLGVIAGMCLPIAVFSIAFSEGEDQAKERARVSGVYEASADALEAMRAKLPVEDFDVKSLAATLKGKSPQEVGDWVGGHVALIAYKGILKGAQGALEDRRGNSLDRALLLQALLAANGVEARLARTTLDEATTDKLLAAVDGAPPPAPPAAVDDQAELDKFYADPRVDGAKVKARNEKERADAAAQFQQSNQRIEKISTSLKTQTDAMLAAKAADQLATRKAALADHWWVQVNSGGTWSDLDPSSAVVGTLSASDTFTPEQLPEDLRRTVTVRVVAEFSREGKISRETLLAHDFDPSAITGRVMILRHRALDLKPFSAFADDPANFTANVTAAVTASSAWAPALAVGDDVYKDRLVATDGDVSEATEANMSLHGGQGGEGAAGLGGGLGGAIAGMSNDLNGEGPYDENTGTVKFTGEFLEVETRNPGEEARIERRTIFDAIGPAARNKRDASAPISDAAKLARGFAMLDTMEIMVTTGRVSPARAAGRIQESYAAAFRATAAWLTANDGSTMPSLPDDFRHVNLPLNAFATGRMTYGPDGDKRIQIEANAAMTRNGLRNASDGSGGLSEIVNFDIIANRLSAGGAAGNLTAGVADTVAEHVAIGAPNTSHNTAIRYADALDRGETWNLIEAGNTAGLSAISADADSLALLSDDLTRGYALVVPQRIASLDDAVWWRIDPVSGETLGMNAQGGQETTEYNITLMISLGNAATCVYKAAKAGPNPDIGKQIGVATCLIGAVAGFSGALAGKLALWQLGAIGGVNGIIGNVADP